MNSDLRDELVRGGRDLVALSQALVVMARLSKHADHTKAVYGVIEFAEMLACRLAVRVVDALPDEDKPSEAGGEPNASE